MRVLLLSPFLPDRHARHGGGALLGSLVHGLAEEIELHLCSLVDPDDAARLTTERDRILPERLGSSRFVVRKRKGDGSALTRAGQQLRMLGRFASGLPVTMAKYASPAMRGAVQDSIERVQPDAVLAELHLSAAWLPGPGGPLRVLTDHESGDPVPAGVLPFGLGRTRDRRLWDRELDRRYARADLLQALNRDDADRLARRLGRDVLARPVPAPDFDADPVELSDSPAIGFLGNHAHLPNPEASRFLVTEVLPRLRKHHPDARLLIAGRGSEAALADLRPTEGLEILGEVDTPADLFRRVRALCTPVFSGSGTRIKVLTAWAHGVPVAGNALGMRGLPTEYPGAALAESADDLVYALGPWLDSKERATEDGARAREWILEHASPKAIAQWQVRAIERALTRR